MENVNNKVVILVTFFLYLITISFISNFFDFKVYSPDSIRFLHFWQNSFSIDFAEASFLENIKDALNASHNYDLGRGRIILYALYGFENILLYSFSALPQNFLLILIILINSHAVSTIISKNLSQFRPYI